MELQSEHKTTDIDHMRYILVITMPILKVGGCEIFSEHRAMIEYQLYLVFFYPVAIMTLKLKQIFCPSAKVIPFLESYHIHNYNSIISSLCFDDYTSTCTCDLALRGYRW